MDETSEFKLWNVEDLRRLVDALCVYPLPKDPSLLEFCMQAVEELNIKEGVYEELKMLY